MENIYFRTKCWQIITEAFIEKIASQYHYSDDQFEVFKQTAWAVRNSIKDQEEAELLIDENRIDVVFSLGRRLDVLIDNYSKSDKLLEALMATNIASALLMEGYNQYEDIAKEQFGAENIKLLFFGMPELPLVEMKSSLEAFKHIKVICNDGGNLVPTQSVIYRMVPSCSSEHMCDMCPIGKSGKCENKVVR